jgi:hypothetical protein
MSAAIGIPACTINLYVTTDVIKHGQYIWEFLGRRFLFLLIKNIVT